MKRAGKQKLKNFVSICPAPFVSLVKVKFQSGTALVLFVSL